MSFIPENWTRYEESELFIYIHRHRASWFVTDSAGSDVLDRFNEKSSGLPVEESRFIARLPDSGFKKYPGRSEIIKPEKINELWLHITDRCNLRCRHCLFSSAPDSGGSLSFSSMCGFITEAFHLGCRMFVLTGGEPFVHPDINEIIRFVTDFPDIHVAVLTNGMLAEKMLAAKRICPERVHFQISLDGLENSHDLIRGKGSFRRAMESFESLEKEGFAFTVSMCVTSMNYMEMPEMVQLASDCGAENIHFMWYFVKGRGDNSGYTDPEAIYPYLVRAMKTAEKLSVNIDNISEIKSRIFSPQGTVHDGSSAAWGTLAIGPDMMLYPSAASIGNTDLASGLSEGLENAWKNSSVMNEIRQTSMAGLDDPFRFILGGGDFDHSYIHSGEFAGADPYYNMYAKLALRIISGEAGRYAKKGNPGLALKMGDILETCGEHGAVALCHSNCLLDVASSDVRSSVAKFYSKAASADSDEILNPVCYPDEYITHIPKKFRFRGYGCGSPVMDADIKAGEHLADLGSGRGIECFIASRIAGKNGNITGIDMLDPMLERARQGAAEVAVNLGYDNLDFKKGFLENLPLPDMSCDVITSNCVLNLSPDKRKTFSEIFRVLKPGGRLVVSDVVCDEEPDPSVRNDEKLRGECIAGAMTQKDLTGILYESGFCAIKLVRRFPYRSVGEHPFYSLTFSAIRPSGNQHKVEAVYRGAFASVITSSGTVLHAGIKTMINRAEAETLGEDIFILDEHGAVNNMFFGESSCCCSSGSNESSCCSGSASTGTETGSVAKIETGSACCCPDDHKKYMSGCMVCGASLYYPGNSGKESVCHYCGGKSISPVICTEGHFVCDACHASDGLGITRRYLTSTDEKDMAKMFSEIKSHERIPMHGPEHHALVSGIIVTAFLNSSGIKNESMILEALERGSAIPGGSCGYTGVCGAASGAGAGFAVILESSPVKPFERKAVQTAVHEILGEIASYEAARCCQRDGWTALKKAAEISDRFLPVRLEADYRIVCDQYAENTECIGGKCPLFYQ